MTDETRTAEDDFEKAVLQKIKIAAVTHISDGCLHDVLGNAEFKIMTDWIPRLLVGKMSSYVWGMNEERIKAQWPADWWQAVKLRFAPAWFLRRWPVRYSKIDKPQFEAVYLSLHGDRITLDPGRKEYAFCRIDPFGNLYEGGRE